MSIQPSGQPASQPSIHPSSQPASQPASQTASQTGSQAGIRATDVGVKAGPIVLEGTLVTPPNATALVIFSHGSGSSRHSPRNRFVAETLNEARLATLLFDLLTKQEEAAEALTRHLRFDIDMLASRLTGAVDWAVEHADTRDMSIGLFGASTGAAAALVTAAARPDVVRAVVSRGGRPDLAADSLVRVEAPTLMIVGGHDVSVIELNEQAAARMHCAHRLEIVPGATHLFEEPGALEQVAQLARSWFCIRLAGTLSAP